MELPYAALHQLCGRLLGRLDALPEPQQRALSVALGRVAGDPPDRFLVALAVLSLMSAASRRAAAAVLRGRSAVGRRRHRAGARLRRPAASRRADRADLRRARAECRAPADGPAGAVADGSRRGGRARPAGHGHPRPDRRARPRPDRGRDARQPARAAGAAARHQRRGAGRRLRLARAGGAVEQHRGRIPAPPRAAPLRHPQAAAAGGGRPCRRAAAPVAGGRTARHRPRRRRARGGDGPAGDRHPRAVPAPARALGRVPLGLARRAPGRCTPRSPRPPIRSSTPTGAPGTARGRRSAPTRTSRAISSAPPSVPRRAAVSPPQPRSWTARRRSPRTPPAACGACSPRRGRCATPVSWMRRWSASRR